MKSCLKTLEESPDLEGLGTELMERSIGPEKKLREPRPVRLRPERGMHRLCR
jgi:hypothetical protein